MKPPPSLNVQTADRSWITRGPNSGGIAGWLLFEDHVFWFEHDTGPIRVDDGRSIAAWLARYGDEEPEIARALRAPVESDSS